MPFSNSRKRSQARRNRQADGLESRAVTLASNRRVVDSSAQKAPSGRHPHHEMHEQLQRDVPIG